MREKGDDSMKSQIATNRRIEYLRYCSEKIDNIDSKKVKEVPFIKKEIDSFYQELNPETLLLEKDEYEYLNYILDNKLSRMEREIIKNIFGFYGKPSNLSKTASKLKISVRMTAVIRDEALRKLTLLLKPENRLTKKKIR